ARGQSMAGSRPQKMLARNLTGLMWITYLLIARRAIDRIAVPLPTQPPQVEAQQRAVSCGAELFPRICFSSVISPESGDHLAQTQLVADDLCTELDEAKRDKREELSQLEVVEPRLADAQLDIFDVKDKLDKQYTEMANLNVELEAMT
ncbi:unnamed protein product, partial [Prorocentrum cordatum]